VNEQPSPLGNPFGTLDLATAKALEASIRAHGVIVPVIEDQHGRVLDGHNRRRIALAHGLDYPKQVMQVRDDEHALELVATLNADRRHLTPEQRQTIAAELREQGHSLRAIAGAVGVGKSTVERDLEQVSHGGTPGSVTGRDGKTYAAKRKPRRRRRTKQPPAERPLYVRFAEAVGAATDVLENPAALAAAIPDDERQQWALTLHGLARLAAGAAEVFGAERFEDER
jgi:ParB-like chromosome segregation protein Spo0J